MTILILLTAPLAGYAFAKMQFRGREPLFALFLAGLVVPAPSAIVALYGNLQFLGLIDTHIGVILPQGALLIVRRRMIWNSRADFVADGLGSSGSGYAA